MAEKHDEAAASPVIDFQHTLYFNGFSMALSTGDVVITLLLQGRPIQTLNVSYTVAKTLATALSAAIEQLEKRTNQPIMTVQTVNEALKKS